MVGDVVGELTEVIEATSPILAERFSYIATFLKAAGIIAIAYIIYLIIAGFLKWKALKRIKKMERDLVRIEGKLDCVLDKKSEKKGKKK